MIDKEINESLAVGKTFKFMGTTYKVVEEKYKDEQCSECAFRNTGCIDLLKGKFIPNCISYFREDNKMVKFIKCW